MRTSEAKKFVIRVLHKLHLYRPTYNVYISLLRLIGKRKIVDHFDRFLRTLENKKAFYQTETVLFYGVMLTERKKAIYEIMDSLTAGERGLKVLVLQNALNLKQEEEEIRDTMVPADVLQFPEYRGWEIEVGLLPPLDVDKTQIFEQKVYLQEAAKNIKQKYPRASDDFLKRLVCEYYWAFSAVLEQINVATVVIWNKFHACNYIFSQLCKERGTRVLYAEFGSLPGTIVLDEGGQMGESWPATHSAEFLKLPVTEEECGQAEKTIEALRMSGLNRNIQPQNDSGESLRKKLKPGRPIILYAGQYDVDSGMVPYTENTRRYHSPCFTSSEEGMLRIAEIAAQHDWNFIFKPHPLVKNNFDPKRLPRNVIFVPDYNINAIIDIADVMVTILSSTAYVSLIRGTAVLMLGYNQISRKGCAYEAYRPEDIESQLMAAVEKGYTADQKNAFIRHVSQMSKYYLYSDGQTREEIHLGKSLQSATEFIEKKIFPASKPAERQGNSCIFCDSLEAFLFALQLCASGVTCSPALVLAGGEHLRTLIDAERCRRVFGAVRLESPESEQNQQLFAKMEELYLPAFGETSLQAAERILQGRMLIPRMHFYGGGMDPGALSERAEKLRKALGPGEMTATAETCEIIRCDVKTCRKDDVYGLCQIGERWRGAPVQEFLTSRGKNRLAVVCKAAEEDCSIGELLRLAHEINCSLEDCSLERT